MSNKALKHIVEERGDEAYEIVKNIPDILKNPTKVVDNSGKRANSYLFVKMSGKIKAVVLEVTKRPDGDQVVSAFFTDRKTYEKMKDVSGRADVPPLDMGV